MPMNLIQFQSELSMFKFFQQFGIEAPSTVILEKSLGSQSFSCSHCGERAPRFVHSRSCRYQTSLILGTLFKSTKLSLTIWFLEIYLISQARTTLSALALKRHLGFSYSRPWLFKFMHTMAEREVLCCLVQVGDAYFGGELRSGSVDRGPENKMCLVATPSLSDEEHPLHIKLTPISFVADGAKCNPSSGCLMLSDGLARFDADCQHRVISVDGGKPKYFPHCVWVNKLLVRLTISLGGVYYAFNFNKYASRCLALFPNCFRRHFDHKTFRERPATCGRHNYQSPNRCLALFG